MFEDMGNTGAIGCAEAICGAGRGLPARAQGAARPDAAPGRPHGAGAGLLRVTANPGSP